MNNLKTFFAAITVALPALCMAESRPNIVLIMVDDMGWSNIGCYGGLVETPNLDALAEDGVRFNQFYNGARCCPTRATLMTGLHPHQAGVGHMVLRTKGKRNFTLERQQQPYADRVEDREGIPFEYQGWLDVTVPTLPEMLQAAGYGTYMTGKWHLGCEDRGTWPKQRGFDQFYGHLSGTSDFWEPTCLFRNNEPILKEGDRFYLTNAISEEAIGFLEEHEKENDEKPFFLYLAYNAPHFPLQCLPEDYEKYRHRFKAGWDQLREEKLARQIEMGIVPAGTELSPRPDHVPAWNTLSAEQQNEMDAIMATYCGMIDSVDQNIGKLVEHLKVTGELDNTIVFFLSDNGAEAESPPLGMFSFEELGFYGGGGLKYSEAWANLSNTPCREYKHFTHQGGVQTPLVVHWPAGIPASQNGAVLSQNGYLPDLVETCLELAAATRPESFRGRDVPEADGVSLKVVLEGSPDPIHQEAICIEHEGNGVVRLGTWKLVRKHDEPWALYDIEKDFSERNNTIEEHPEIAANLEQAYQKWAARCGVRAWDTAREWSVYQGQRKAKEKEKSTEAGGR